MYEQDAARIEHIMNDPLAGGAQAAYKALKDDLADFAKTHSSRETVEFWHGVTDELQRRGALPHLSVAWAQSNQSLESIANGAHRHTQRSYAPEVIDTNNDGFVDRTEIRQQQESAYDAVFAGQMLAKQRKRDFFDDVAHEHHDGYGYNVLEQGDFENYFRHQHKQAETMRKQDNTRDAMSPLFNTDDDGRSLLDYLDQNGNHRVSRHEMNKFLNEYSKHQGEGIYTEDNAEFVQRLKEHNVCEIDRGPFGPGFYTNKLARKGGFDVQNTEEPVNYDELKNSYDQKNMDRHPELRERIAYEDEKSGAQPAEKHGVAEAALALKRAEDVAFDDEINQRCTVRPGEGYWQSAARLLGIDIGPHGLDSTADQNTHIWHLTKDLVRANGAALGDDNKARPTLHPGDVIQAAPQIDDLAQRNPELAKSMGALRAKIHGDLAGKLAQRQGGDDDDQGQEDASARTGAREPEKVTRSDDCGDEGAVSDDQSDGDGAEAQVEGKVLCTGWDMEEGQFKK
jgi:hypothetical protein